MIDNVLYTSLVRRSNIIHLECCWIWREKPHFKPTCEWELGKKEYDRCFSFSHPNLCDSV